jgi:hypothetical protein
MLIFPQLRLESTIRIGGRPGVIEIADRVTNFGSKPAELELLYHINYGMPWMAPGGVIRVPAKRIAPRDDGAAAAIGHWNTNDAPTSGVAEQVYFFDPLADRDGKCLAVMADEKAALATAVRFRKDQLPYFTLWKNPAALEDGYVTGLEPGTDFPNNRSFEREKGRVVTLAPGQARNFDLEIEFTEGPDGVRRLLSKADELQRSAPAELMRAPHSEWSKPSTS